MFPTNASQRNINVENPQVAAKASSTAFDLGMWLEYDGSGHIQPLAATDKVVGLCLTSVPVTDATNALITYDGINSTEDRFLMPVTTGTATSSMIGSTFDVDTNSYGLDVSGPGTQFLITRVLTDAEVEVAVVLLAN